MRHLCDAQRADLEWRRSHEGLATKHDLDEWGKKIMATEAEVKAALDKIDAATTKTAANLQVVADLDQKISDELDALLAKLQTAGVSQELLDATSALAERAQASSDALDAQVPVLQAIAAKGAANPVPLPVPPAPTP